MAARKSKNDSSRLARGTSGGSRGDASNLDEADAEEEEEYEYTTPRIDGKKITITFPLRSPVACVVGNCKVRVKGETKDVVINSFKRHLKEIHKINFPAGSRINMCGICHTNIGRMITHHACFRERKLFVNSDEKFPFQCDICSKGYDSYKGLNNHKVAHRNRDLQDKYNRENGLPVAGNDEVLDRAPVEQTDVAPQIEDIVITDDDIEKFLEITTGGGISGARKERDRDKVSTIGQPP